MQAQYQNKVGTVAARWLSFANGATYSGLSVRYLELAEHAGNIIVARVTPNGSRGKRLIDRESLDRFIGGFVGNKPAALAVNEGRAI